MRQKILIVGLIIGLWLVGSKDTTALSPLQVNKVVDTKILVVTATPTPTPTLVKLIRPSIKLEIKITPKLTATVTPSSTVTPTKSEILTPTATPTTEIVATPTPIVKEVTQEKIPSYMLIIIGALIGIIVVQAWPKKPQA